MFYYSFSILQMITRSQVDYGPQKMPKVLVQIQSKHENGIGKRVLLGKKTGMPDTSNIELGVNKLRSLFDECVDANQQEGQEQKDCHARNDGNLGGK